MPQRAAATATTPPRKRAPRVEGERTTLRVPNTLIAQADLLAAELGISRNDALIRLATRGAELQDRQRQIAERRDARWAAVMQHATSVEPGEFPSAEEIEQAIFGPHEDDPE
ncbi:MAG TPA: hypothetical protein VN238_00110 [Solirubrobacteraceae bacterium]|nr:hypothetical protein [Solirubrobacteraceae bacterium]